MSTTGPAILDLIDPVNAVMIGGAWVAGNAGTFVVEDPADKTVIAAVAAAGQSQATAAVDAAHRAAATWADTSPRDRSEILHGTFRLMLDHTEGLAEVISRENGKSVADARAEVSYAAEYFRWYAEEAVRAEGNYGAAPGGSTRTIVTHRPVGIAALVTPWNFPAAMATRKIAPALAAGCTVVLKPAAETPLTAMLIAELMRQAGTPDGVVNLVPTDQAPRIVSTWLADPRVRKLSFTGSTATGKKLLHQASDRVLNTSMELGGNAPFIVLKDADVATAVDGAMTAKFRGGGQACTAANRFYVHESILDEFTTQFAAKAQELIVGPASRKETEIGPLISQAAVRKAQDLIDDALARGAHVAARATVPAELGGHYLAPTVLAGVTPDARAVQEEIFAPVAPIVAYEDEAALISMVNGTEMGLAAYVYSRDLQRALQLAESIEAGMFGINRGLLSDPAAPFGGLKQSGLGREGARDGLREYQETQYLSVDWAK